MKEATQKFIETLKVASVAHTYSSSYDLTPDERRAVIEENEKRGLTHLLKLDVDLPHVRKKDETDDS